MTNLMAHRSSFQRMRIDHQVEFGKFNTRSSITLGNDDRREENIYINKDEKKKKKIRSFDFILDYPKLRMLCFPAGSDLR
jgi:hypothetical protein